MLLVQLVPGFEARLLRPVSLPCPHLRGVYDQTPVAGLGEKVLLDELVHRPPGLPPRERHGLRELGARQPGNPPRVRPVDAEVEDAPGRQRQLEVGVQGVSANRVTSSVIFSHKNPTLLPFLPDWREREAQSTFRPLAASRAVSSTRS